MIYESGEMYLETILILSKSQPEVHAVDVAAEMKISKASVSRAMGRLRAESCIIIDQTGRIAFTEKGRAIAEKIYERHTVLTELLTSLGVNPETAAADACRIEHDISDETFDCIKAHRDKMSRKKK
ncbi:MAG: metal-dependent transcriptional regulator [Lachnospiraceae bacterium]|jgi:Mn-dependent DtxR family transcriptional regulator|nr:metal-dependent transcriptional regulator [Lachnospiraceae bacterium]